MTTSLKQRLAEDRLLVLPGAANALTARVIEDAGFEAVYVTGAGVSNTFLGMPDIGLLTVTQLADHVAAMSDAVALPLIVDADTGFGNAINTRHSVQLLERSGAAAIQLEDQTFPKRCGHFSGKHVVPKGEMVQKIHAAVDARRSEETLIVARTDAISVEGIDAAIERALAYREAGADIMFVEAPGHSAEIERISAEVPGPKLINIVHGGSTPELPQSRIVELGFDIALYANHALLAQIAGVRAMLGHLREDDGAGLAQVMESWSERQRLVGLPEIQLLEARYADES